MEGARKEVFESVAGDGSIKRGDKFVFGVVVVGVGTRIYGCLLKGEESM